MGLTVCSKGGATMFMQVIQGRAADPAGFTASIDRWMQELGPGADGWLGTTSGMYGDNEFIALVRFESADAAKHNSDRPEQGQWWSEVASYLDGDARFDDYDDVTLMGPGGPTKLDLFRSCGAAWPTSNANGQWLRSFRRCPMTSGRTSSAGWKG